ncbi:MAG: hypothetical protein GYA24_02265 [Candidatus Lokiarchaeota archaeon]|nr:hypothetical protein [Candidatus Lokiarchaeota archaeon]
MAEIGLSIDQVVVFDANGISIFLKQFKESQLDQNLLAAFFSAIRQFASHMMQGEIQGIKIGNVLLNFKILPFENENFVFLMVSSGFSETWASEIADKLAENFAIHLENYLVENKIDFTDFRAKMHVYTPSFMTYYTPLCEELVKDVNKLDTISLDLPIKVPSTLLMFIYDFIAARPDLQKTYENGGMDILVEAIQNYVFSDRVKRDVAQKFKGHD